MLLKTSPTDWPRRQLMLALLAYDGGDLELCLERLAAVHDAIDARIMEEQQCPVETHD